MVPQLQLTCRPNEIEDRRGRRGARVRGITTLLVALSLLAATAAPSAAESPVAAPSNIIVLVGDGMGFNQVDAASLYQHGQSRYQLRHGDDGRVEALGGPASQVYQRFAVQYASTTYDATGRYDPRASWSDFDHVRSRPTDSAAAATALSTGVKTSPGAIGVDVDGLAITHLAERAKDLGKATGVVTTMPFSHATPAGFTAHAASRDSYHAIAREMILDSDTNVIMGAGHPHYDDRGQRRAPDHRYISEQLFARVRDGATPYRLVEDRADLQRLAQGSTPTHVLGLARVGSSLQYRRGGTTHTDPYTVPFDERVPTLAELTLASLNVLDNASTEGLFVMIEGGAIDSAGHGNDLGRLIEEQVSFNEAVEAAVGWVEQHSGWDETLVIVTADHETGYLTGADADPTWTPMDALGAGSTPSAAWNSARHTNQLVPLYAEGAGSTLFADLVEGVDPVRGEYVDLTAVARVGFALWGTSAVCEGRRHGPTFPDAPGSGHQDAIECLARLGVVHGNADGTFGPRGEVSRGQLASFMVRAIERSTGGPMPSRGPEFTDLRASSTHGDASVKLRTAGVVEGYPDGTFRPRDPVTREQTARYVVNALELVLDERLPRSQRSFPDVVPGSRFASDVDALVTAGVVSGFSDGTFGPREPVTRGQMARFIANALEVLDRST